MEDKWLFEITPKNRLINLNLKEIWRYRDLLMLFVRRDIVTVYKQTILGPLWFLIQPLFTSIIFTIIFNNVANIETGAVPAFVFNLAGITLWNYFKECLSKTSSTFTANANIFGKVYFPRAIMPISITISNLLKLGIQVFIFIAFYLYYNMVEGAEIRPNELLLLFPAYIIIIALLGLGMGMTISALTTKYRDFTVLVGFATSLLMYMSAVPFPLSEIYNEKPEYIWIFKYNPLAHIIEGFRYITLDTGIFSWSGFIYSAAFSIILFLIGLVIFNKTEKTFIDTV